MDDKSLIQIAAMGGVMGLGVMGAQLALNLAEKLGSPVSGFDLDGAKGAGTRRASIAAGLRVRAFTSLRPFARSLKRPRKVLLLVPAGKPTDAAIKALMRVLSKGDVIVDCGNEWYVNTQRRERQLRAAGLRYLGCGLSGGARGARDGPGLLPGRACHPAAGRAGPRHCSRRPRFQICARRC